MLRIDKNKLMCPQCGGKMVPAIAVNGGPSTFWMRCEATWCRTFIDTYVPNPPQEVIHRDTSLYLGIFGGYGSGKTACSLKDDEKHMLITPKGETVVGSAVLSQVEQTYEKDFINDFPAEFIVYQNKQKKSYTLVNGHTLLIKSYYEPDILRSLNASRIHIVEASAVDYEIFTQLQTRLRSEAATIPELDEHGDFIFDSDQEGNQSLRLAADWRKGIVESNPDAGWIRENFLLHSHSINTHGLPQKYFPTDPNRNFSSHIIGTKANPYLPPTFYEEQAKNKPKWWVSRYLNGSFDYAEGMVYPSAFSSFIDSFPVPANWKRVVALDYGIRDETATIYIAIDSKNGVAYAYDEDFINNVSYKTISARYHEKAKDALPPGSLYRSPVMDGKSINKRNDLDLKTIGDLFREEGIFFEAAQMSLEARISKVNTLFEAGQLKIMADKCPNLCRELMKYKFAERTSDGKSTSDKPVDKKNHAINALEFAAMELPEDLTRPIDSIYNDNRELLRAERKHTFSPYAEASSSRTPKRRDNLGDFGSLFTSEREGGSLW